VSVCLPHQNRSWIGKALLVGKAVQPTYYSPPPRPSGEVDASYVDTGITSTKPHKADAEQWILVNSTPATCAQLGLFHLFTDRAPIDLVVSGPNYGRNTTAVFALSSGTLGGALEAAVCGKRAIALSYAFKKKDHHDPLEIAATSRMSVRVIENLAKNWEDGVQVYSINVPLGLQVERSKVWRTHMLQNQWKTSCFTAIEVPEEEDWSPEQMEAIIRDGESSVAGGAENNQDTVKHTPATHKHFQWSPRFVDVYESVAKSQPGNDGWVVNHDEIR
jgi:tubulin---tyrosine ligase